MRRTRPCAPRPRKRTSEKSSTPPSMLSDGEPEILSFRLFRCLYPGGGPTPRSNEGKCAKAPPQHFAGCHPPYLACGVPCSVRFSPSVLFCALLRASALQRPKPRISCTYQPPISNLSPPISGRLQWGFQRLHASALLLQHPSAPLR